MLCNELYLKKFKSDISNSFLILLQNEDLEIRIFNNKLFVYYWSDNDVIETNKLNRLQYEIPHYLCVSYKKDTINKIKGLSFQFTNISRNIIQTQLKIFYNLIKGLIQNYEKIIHIFGTGFKFVLLKDKDQGLHNLIIHSGFNIPTKLIIPKNINVILLDSVTIKLMSIDKQELTNFGSLIKRIKPINRYKLRGIKYEDDVFVRKTYKKTK